MFVGLHVATNFEMYRQNSEKALLGGGGGGNCPPAPPGYANGWQCQGSRLWFGRESAREAHGKFKDLVCLVVFLCWIKRFVYTFIVFKMQNLWIDIFQAFKNRGGTIPPPPRKIRGGGGESPRDRRLWLPCFYCRFCALIHGIVVLHYPSHFLSPICLYSFHIHEKSYALCH